MKHLDKPLRPNAWFWRIFTEEIGLIILVALSWSVSGPVIGRLLAWFALLVGFTLIIDVAVVTLNNRRGSLQLSDTIFLAAAALLGAIVSFGMTYLLWIAADLRGILQD